MRENLQTIFCQMYLETSMYNEVPKDCGAVTLWPSCFKGCTFLEWDKPDHGVRFIAYCFGKSHSACSCRLSAFCKTK